LLRQIMPVPFGGRISRLFKKVAAGQAVSVWLNLKPESVKRRASHAHRVD